MSGVAYGVLACVLWIVVEAGSVVFGRALGARLLRVPAHALSAQPADGHFDVPRWRRALWHGFGPCCAYVACAAIGFVALLGQGEARPPTLRITPNEGSAAEAAGIEDGDRIVSINGVTLQQWRELSPRIRALGDRPATIVVQRHGERRSLKVTPRNGRIGVSPLAEYGPIAPSRAARSALTLPIHVVRLAVVALVRAYGGVDRIELTGPIGVIRQGAASSGKPDTSWLMLVAILLSYAWPTSLLVEAALTPRRDHVAACGLLQLAGRDVRLFAFLMDSGLGVVAAGAGGALAMAAHSGASLDAGLGLGALLLLSVQWLLITTTGQSIGKRWLRLRIVRRDGSPAGFVNGVLLRSWIPSLVGAIPLVGLAIIVLDPLVIFDERRRCLHDYVARTWVVSL